LPAGIARRLDASAVLKRKDEIADNVARSVGNYEEAALVSVIGCSRALTAPFKGKTGVGAEPVVILEKSE
jgi:hypothetical protein